MDTHQTALPLLVTDFLSFMGPYIFEALIEIPFPVVKPVTNKFYEFARHLVIHVRMVAVAVDRAVEMRRIDDVVKRPRAGTPYAPHGLLYCYLGEQGLTDRGLMFRRSRTPKRIVGSVVFGVAVHNSLNSFLS